MFLLVLVSGRWQVITAMGGGFFVLFIGKPHADRFHIGRGLT
jgi:hypothetical protein